MTINTMLSKMESDNMTPAGKNILRILKEESMPMSALLTYFMETPNLFETWCAIERNQGLYSFQIPVQYWNFITGFMPPEYDFQLTTDDGCLFYDCYYDADYRDPTEPDRYIYLAIR